MLPLAPPLTALILALLGSAPRVFAQDAAPPDRNLVNTRARPGGMQADSPVTFPEHGALPARFPPDVQEESWPVEKDYYLFSSPCRSLAQIEAIQAAMPAGRFTPPPNDWQHLTRTRRLLTEGGSLHLIAIGDSIINDTMRSGWVALWRAAYPKADIRATVYVRGGGGSQHYREAKRIEEVVVPRRPDLVFLGGISQRSVEDIAAVIAQLRAALPEVEILLGTGAFGTADPRDAAALAAASHSGTGAYGPSLRQLAAEQRCAYLDFTSPWAEYLNASGLHPHHFYRDVVHANEFGEQVLAKILMSFWMAPPATPAQPARRADGYRGIWFTLGQKFPHGLESHLYFADSSGKRVWRLPYHMSGETAMPAAEGAGWKPAPQVHGAPP